MNKCRYCGEALVKTKGNSWSVSCCEYAKSEWELSMKIQGLEKELIDAKKTLKKFREKLK